MEKFFLILEILIFIMQFKIVWKGFKMINKKKLLKPKIDVVFHSLFRVGNEDITKAIITAITRDNIETVDMNNDRHIIGKYAEEKLGILDLKVTLDNGTICDIEIQLADNKDTAERFLYYWSRVYSGQLVKGDDYKKLNKVIGIIILDYKFEKIKEIESIHSKWKIKETLSGKEIELTDTFELHIIEIPKARRILEREPKNEIAQWMMFLNNPNEEEVFRIVKENKEIKRAMKELEEISENEELRRIAELREKAIRDEKNALRHAIESGFEQGIEEGIKQGMEQGIEVRNIEIVKKLIQRGEKIENIIEITGLTKEKILEIKEQK